MNVQYIYFSAQKVSVLDTAEWLQGEGDLYI